jgi:PAS domain S-box-containing protein
VVRPDNAYARVSRRLVFAGVGLLALQATVIASLGTETPGPFLSDLIQLALGLVCMLGSVLAFRRSSGVARHTWRLLAIFFSVWMVAQTISVYVDLAATQSLNALNDILFFAAVIPFGVLVFLDPENEPDQFDRLHILDFIQVSIFWLVIYVYFSPGLWSSQSAFRLGPFTWSRAIAYDGLLAASFIVRALLTSSSVIRALFGRMALYFVVAGLAESYALRPGNDVPTGGWFDLVWSLLLGIPVVIAATWRHPNTSAKRPERVQNVIVNQVYPLLYPLVSFLLLVQIARNYRLLATVILIATFAVVAIRVLIIQRRHERTEEQLRTDVAERKRTELALRRSEEKYRDLFEQAKYGIFRATPQGKFLDVNPALVGMLGYSSKEELMACNLNQDVYENPAEGRSALARCDRNGGTDGAEVKWKRKNGARIVARLTGRSIRGEGEEPESFEVIVDDITERRSLELQLAQAQKLEAVGRLAGGVAHDFNNALGVICGYCELLQLTLAADDSRYRQVDEIGKAAKRAASMTRQLLAFSRKQLIHPTVLDLNLVVTDMEKMLGRLIGEDVVLTMVRDPKLKNVRADRGQMEQVLMNLAVNARDAMPRGGRLLIETENIELDDAYARQHPDTKPGSYVVLGVSDTGSGMDKETQSHIFEPFFTTKEVGRGTGLGLSTVYGIVKQSGGYVSVYSELGKGTTIRIFLPQVEAPAESGQRIRVWRKPLQGTETILLVEDEESLRDLTQECLQKSGYVVLEARDGRTALQMAKQHAGTIHLLLTDLVMPGMSGRELAEDILPSRPEMKILYMSGYTNDLVTQHGILDPGTTLLEKPFALDSLLSKVRQVLDGKAVQT